MPGCYIYCSSVCTFCTLHTLYIAHFTLHIAHIVYCTHCILHIAQCAVAPAGAHWGALLSICLYFLYLALPEETTHQSSHPSLIDECDEKEISSELTHKHQNLNNDEFEFYLFKNQTKNNIQICHHRITRVSQILNVESSAI